MNKIFSYKVNDSPGLFYFIREHQDIYHVDLLSPKPFYTENQFCKEGVSGSDASALIDGKNTTAWANKQCSKEYQYIIVDLKQIKFKLTNVVVETVCACPHTVTISGSNDNSSSFRYIGHGSEFNDYERTRIRAPASRTFRFIKISQNYQKKNENEVRFHLSEIEFFGILNPKIETAKKNTKTYLIIFIITISIASN